MPQTLCSMPLSLSTPDKLMCSHHERKGQWPSRGQISIASPLVSLSSGHQPAYHTDAPHELTGTAKTFSGTSMNFLGPPLSSCRCCNTGAANDAAKHARLFVGMLCLVFENRLCCNNMLAFSIWKLIKILSMPRVSKADTWASCRSSKWQS